jgi:toxin CcdB
MICPRGIVALLQPVETVSGVISRLTPRFEVGGKMYVMASHRMAALALTEIGTSVADLSAHADEIIAATDFLFQGFRARLARPLVPR